MTSVLHKPTSHPLTSCSDEELDFILRLVLCSGSLKDLAASYRVSYPTIRARLDRVIERLRAEVEGRPRDPMIELLASLVEQGEITPSAARRILAVAPTATDHGSKSQEAAS